MIVLSRVLTSSLKPDIVFLQEVVIKNLDVIKGRCSNDYAIILGTEKGNAPSMQYFIVALLRRSTVECMSHSVTPFSGSVMSRTILHVVVGGNRYHRATTFSSVVDIAFFAGDRWLGPSRDCERVILFTNT